MESNKKVLLSLCILSYNQVDEIRRLFDSIKNQITPEVEVFIRDDSNNNDTENLVNEYTAFFPIRYIHGTKEGIDKTVIFLTKEAQGRFVWWLGDDVIEPGSVSRVLKLIKEESDIDFIWANYHIVGHSKLAIDLPKDGYFESVDQLLELGYSGLGFISATIFNREKALSGISLAEKYVGSLFSNLCIVLWVLSQRGKCFYFRDPIITCYPTTPEEIKRMTNKGGIINNRGFEVYGITFYNILHEFDGKFSKEAIKKTIKKNFSSFWRGMVVGWIGEWDTPKGKRLPLIRRYWIFPEAWLAFVLFFIPRSINRILFSFYKLFFSHREFKYKHLFLKNRK
jgi:glycosyltransferase involved in cell wall biosynthesis